MTAKEHRRGAPITIKESDYVMLPEEIPNSPQNPMVYKLLSINWRATNTKHMILSSILMNSDPLKLMCTLTDTSVTNAASSNTPSIVNQTIDTAHHNYNLRLYN